MRNEYVKVRFWKTRTGAECQLQEYRGYGTVRHKWRIVINGVVKVEICSTVTMGTVIREWNNAIREEEKELFPC